MAKKTSRKVTNETKSVKSKPADLKYNLKEDPPESAMEIVRGSKESLARYAYYVKLLQDDDEFNLNMLESHRIAVMFTLVDRFKTWEIEKDKEEWVTFLKNNYSVADLMRKYEEFALKYLQNAKGVRKGPVSVFDQAREIIAEFRKDGGELRIEWKGEEVLEGVAYEYEDSESPENIDVQDSNSSVGDKDEQNNQRPEDIEEDSAGQGADTPQTEEGDRSPPERVQDKKDRQDSD